ncbi:hypothetical protein ACOP1M_00080 [Staphylococcus warneri]|mgnify:CR=1 FL=1|uniref:hypothetical protein n=1 Tax=Staphylococcus warneri TaxID=1292 RepID=UPI001F56D3EF|nr:hypothetical protein [Staphylococcus warneri]MCI2770649.1 hypothetical protein [Staphylococcus warneri]MCI2783368.1 hypothetical protein [Staphylococcus warneri]
MKLKTRKTFKAKRVQFKIAVIESELRLKDVAIETDSSYSTIVQVANASINVSELRAKSIANVLGKKVEDIFEQV